MTPDSYQERCPEAPLTSEDLASYLTDNQITPDGEGLKKQDTLFGIEFLTDILPGELVPDCDTDYVLQEDLCQKVLVSLKEGEKVLPGSVRDLAEACGGGIDNDLTGTQCSIQQEVGAAYAGSQPAVRPRKWTRPSLRGQCSGLSSKLA